VNLINSLFPSKSRLPTINNQCVDLDHNNLQALAETLILLCKIQQKILSILGI
jgi:hypothetical protein